MPPRPHPPAPTPEALFLEHLELIDRLAERAGWRAGFAREEREDFASEVRLKLMADDYAVFRQFEGRAQLRTYLAVVIQRAAQDYRDRLWGKWRPSAEAQRLGGPAIALERLTSRDGYSLDEASEVLRRNHGLEVSHKEVLELFEKLPPRNPLRRVEGEEKLESRPAEEGSADALTLGREAAARKQEVLALLQQGLQTLEPMDRLIARMSADRKVADIARILKLEPKPLYRRLDRLRECLREFLEAHGVRREELPDLLEAPEEPSRRRRK